MWILPTRSRPHNVRRFFEHWALTHASTPGVLVVDSDQAELYADIEIPENWIISVYPRMSMCAKSNRSFWDHPGMDWYGFVDDDAVPMTPYWDRELVEAAGKDGLAHPWNGIGNSRLASQFVIGGELARELGWIFLPGLSRIYGDDVITAIADRKGVRTYLGDVKLEQRHFSNGLAEMDETYKKPEAAEDERIYREWLCKFAA